MQSIQGADSYIVTDGGPAPNPPMPPLTHGQPGVAAVVSRVAGGVAVLVDWLGSGANPVENSLSEARAGVCAACPENQPSDWSAIFTKPVAEKIRKQLEIRKEMSLSTSQDAKLQTCAVCLCSLRLKVHVPLKHIVQHLPAHVRLRLHPSCWILSESSK
jgi:hypothetical protein